MTSLRSLYEGFLRDPRRDLLSPDVSLHYITTTTTINGADEVAQHLVKLNTVNTKKADKVLTAVEGPSSLCLDIETTMTFLTGEGPYLLTLDDTFIVDRTITFPTIHIVHYDSLHKISQIRVHWDQGSFLKQLDVIGSRQRHWPIGDGVEQTKLINSSISAVEATAPVTLSHAKDVEDHQAPSAKSLSPKRETVKSAHGEPQNEPISPTKRASRFSAKPPPRDYNDLFATGKSESTIIKDPPKNGNTDIAHQGGITSVVPQLKRSSQKQGHFEFGEAEAPAPTVSRPPKHGHFEFGQAEPPTPSKQSSTPYSPFEFGDAPPSATPGNKKSSHFGSDEPSEKPLPVRAHASKHLSQWDFSDFATPEKPQKKTRPQDVRHFGWSDDEVDLTTPRPKPRAVHPRRDAESHFKLQDEEPPVTEEELSKRTTGTARNKGLGLYENNLYSESGDAPAETESIGSAPSHSNNISRKKDFDSHWVMADEPLSEEETKAAERKPSVSGHNKAVQMMGSSWDVFDEPTKEQENSAATARPKKAGRDVNQRSWGFGGDNEF